jgi:REP element-mobilizing transposase RayT
MTMTRYDPSRHHRRSIRLRGFDYARPGTYFVTICTRQRECLFGEVIEGTMILSDFGQVVHEEWHKTSLVRPYVTLDAFVVMPNHVHGILMITDDRRGTAPPCPYQGQFGHPIPRSLPTIIRAFKSATTQRVNQMRGTPGMPLWQRNYYEHIVRDEDELNQIRRYISENLLKWELDENNPSRWPQKTSGLAS